MEKFINPNKIFYHPDRLVQWSLGRIRAINPITIELHLSNICNNKCLYCSMDKIKDKKMLSYSEVKQAIDFIKAINILSICLTGGGEPTLHPNFIDTIKYIFQKELEIGIITNGIEIHDHQTILKYSKWIRISIDAADPDTYYAIRRSHSFNQVCDNIDHLIHDNTGNCVIGIQVVVNKYNYSDLYNSVNLLLKKFPDIHYIHIRPIELKINETAYSFDERKIIFEHLEKLSDNKKLIISDKWNLFKDNKKFFGFKKCYAAPYIGVIDVYGDFYLCCHTLKNEEYRYCNIFDLKDTKEFFIKREKILQALGANYGLHPNICPLACRGSGINISLEKMINDQHKNFL